MFEPPNYDARFVEGVAYFNECDFFEAHEIWEDLWARLPRALTKVLPGHDSGCRLSAPLR